MEILPLGAIGLGLLSQIQMELFIMQTKVEYHLFISYFPHQMILSLFLLHNLITVLYLLKVVIWDLHHVFLLSLTLLFIGNSRASHLCLLLAMDFQLIVLAELINVVISHLTLQFFFLTLQVLKGFEACPNYPRLLSYYLNYYYKSCLRPSCPIVYCNQYQPTNGAQPNPFYYVLGT